MKKGFTLIELLIVIAILGTIAVVALLAIDPLEQLRRSRDAGRLSTVAQLGHAVQGYATGSADGSYPPGDEDWIETLTNSGEITTTPSDAGGDGCTNNAINNWCYDSDGEEAIVYARLESTRNKALCANPDSEIAWAVYSTEDGRGGVVCTGGSEPTAGGIQPFRN